jgi:hypothetical protein
MLENNGRQQQSAPEGFIISDPNGVVIAWRDGIARRFSWEQLRQFSLTHDMSGQSAQQEVAPVLHVA